MSNKESYAAGREVWALRSAATFSLASFSLPTFFSLPISVSPCLLCFFSFSSSFKRNTGATEEGRKEEAIVEIEVLAEGGQRRVVEAAECGRVAKGEEFDAHEEGGR
jgi:hypothetical protein